AKHIPSCITEGADRIDLPGRSIARQTIPLGSIRQQGAGVKPTAGPRVRYMPISDNVRSILCSTSSGIALIASREHGERRTGLKSQYSTELPSACDTAQWSTRNLAKWQIVDVAEDEAMRDVKVGDRTLGAKVSGVLREGSA